MKTFNFIKNPELWEENSLFEEIISDTDFNFLKSANAEHGRREIIEAFLIDEFATATKETLDKIERELSCACKIIQEDFPNLTPKIYIFGMSPKNEHAIQSTNGLSATAATRRILFTLKVDGFKSGQITTCLVHELNHVARLQKFSFFSSGTLLDWMIFEGVTELYQTEKIRDHSVSKWCTATTSAELDFWFPKVHDHFGALNSEFIHSREWIFGSKGETENKIPKWFGYALGFDIVKRFRMRHPQMLWNELIQLPSEIIAEGYHR